MKPLRALFFGLGLAILPSFARSAPAFKHVVLIIQENRTPDNLFGSNPKFEPGVDILPEGRDSAGQLIHFGPVELNACYDVNHSHIAFEDAYGGAWDKEPVSKAGDPNCRIPVDPQFKYVDNSRGQIQPYFDIASQFGFANRMFQTNQGPSFPAHLFLFSGTSAPSANSRFFAAENMKPNTGQVAGCIAPPSQRTALIDAHGNEADLPKIYPCVDTPTMADLLEKHGLGWTYYAWMPTSLWTSPTAVSHICQAGGPPANRVCKGPDWIRNVHANNPSRILTDIAGCRLREVTWLTPFGDWSDHPGGNNGLGPSWVASVVNAIGQQQCGAESYWNDTAIFILWDDWGGWVDHVRPFKVPAPPDWGAGYTYGFRVPLLAVSAYTAAGTVSNNLYDFGNLLYFIEKNFGMGFIGNATGHYTEYADFHASGRGDLSEFFTLSQPRRFNVIPGGKPTEYFTRYQPKYPAPDDD